MWYPAAITVAASAEPVSLAQAREQCGVQADETYHDAKLTRLIAVARAYAENHCSVRFASQTVVLKCEAFTDMARLPEAPVTSVTSISYVDPEGDTQTLSTDVYELRNDGLETSIILKLNQTWPAIQSKSRITLTAVVGYATVPPDAQHAMLLHIADGFHEREPKMIGSMTTVEGLLSNYRRSRE